MFDVDSVRDFYEELLSQELGEADSVDVVLGLAVCDHDGDEVLSDVAPVPPRLPKPQEEIRRRGLTLDDGVVLESRSEVVGVIKNPRGSVLVQLGGFFPRRRGTGAVHDGPAERSDVDPSLVVDIEYNPIAHGVEDILRSSLRVVLGEEDGVRVPEFLLVFWRCTSVRGVRDDAARTVRAVDVLGVDWDGSVVDSYLELAWGDMRGDGWGGRVPQCTQDLLDIIRILLTVDSGAGTADGGAGRVAGGLNGTGNGYKGGKKHIRVIKGHKSLRTLRVFYNSRSSETLDYSCTIDP